METVRVVFDVFPAQVTTPDAVHRDARAILTEDGLLEVYSATTGLPNPGPGPYRVVQETALSHEGTADRRAVVQVASGSITVVPTRGCGCGSPLRSYDPWPGARIVKVG